MSGISLIIAGIISVFFVLLALKSFLPKKIHNKICVLCTAVGLTWVSLLVLYWLRIFQDMLIIALLMGSTVLGIFYIAEKHVADKWKFFRLPFYLTLVIAGYSLLGIPEDLVAAIIWLAGLWGLFLIIFSYRNNEKTNSFVKKMIECCRNW